MSMIAIARCRASQVFVRIGRKLQLSVKQVPIDFGYFRLLRQK